MQVSHIVSTKGKWIPAIGLILLLSPVAYGQNTVIISGTVTDAKTTESLLGASVGLSRAGIGTSVELNGFSLTCPRGERPDTLVVSYVGYRPKRLIVVPRTNTQLQIALQPASQLLLAQVEVTAKQPIAEDFVLQKLDYLQIVTNPAAAADPLLAVRTLPSSTTTDESANISLRGSDPSQTGIYLNNAPIYDAVKFAQLNGLGTFSIFNPNLVKSLLVFPSNPPLEYGNTGSGLIGITTDDKRQSASLEVGIGLANSGFFGALPVGQRGMLKIYGNFQSGALLRTLNPRAFADLSSLRLGDGGLHYATPFGHSGTLKLYSYGVGEQYGYRYTAPSVSGTYHYQKNRALYVGCYERIFSKADLSLSQAFSRSRSATAIGNYHAQQTNTDWYGSAAYRYYWTETISTRIGTSYDQRVVRIVGQFPLHDYAMSETAPSIADTVRQHRILWEAFQYTKINLGTFVFGLGLRRTLPGMAFQYLSYQGNARYNLSGNQFLNLSGGQYNTVTTPEPATYPFQLSQIRQLALDYSYTSSGWTVTAAVYAKREQGLSSADILGAEAYAQHAFGKRLTADLSAVSLHVNTNKNGSAGLFYSPSRRDLPFILKSSWQAAFSWLNIGFIAQYRAGLPYTPIIGSTFDSQLMVYQPIYPVELNRGRLPRYFRSDISANKMINFANGRTSLLIYVVLNNIFDTHNIDSYSYNADYSASTPAYFQQRSIYTGLVFNIK